MVFSMWSTFRKLNCFMMNLGPMMNTQVFWENYEVVGNAPTGGSTTHCTCIPFFKQISAYVSSKTSSLFHASIYDFFWIQAVESKWHLCRLWIRISEVEIMVNSLALIHLAYLWWCCLPPTDFKHWFFSVTVYCLIVSRRGCSVSSKAFY